MNHFYAARLLSPTGPARHLAVGLCALVWLSACGDDPKPSPVGQVDDNNDVLVNNDTNNQPNNENNDPLPPPPLIPTTIQASASPLRHVYAPGLLVLPEATVFDQFGRPYPEGESPELTWTIEPPEAGTLQDTGRFKLETIGDATLVGCVPVESGESVCGSFDLIVDGQGPQISITSPQPGQWFVADQSPEVTVTGTITDDNGEVAVRGFVNGDEVDLDAEGNFTYVVEPSFGINHVDVVATDGLQAIESVGGVDFVWAQSYLPVPEDRAQVGFDQGVKLRIAQNFMDDGEPLALPDETPATVLTEDLAGILELLLYEIDIMSQVPDPVVDQAALTLRIPSVRIGQPRIEVTIIEGGFELYIQLQGLRAGTQGRFDLQGVEVDLTGAITATASAFVRVRLNKPSADAPYDVGIETLEMAIEEAESQFASGEANAIFDLAESALRGVLEDTLLGALEGSFIDDLPNQLLSLFDSLENSLNGLNFDLDLGFGQPAAVGLTADVTLLEAVPNNRLEATVAMGVQTNANANFPEAPGVALEFPIEQPPPFFTSSPIQIAMSVGLLNGLLHTIWNAGILNIDASEILPAELSFLLEAAFVSGKLPPMITVPTPEDGIDGDVIITLGQLELAADFGDQQDAYAFNIKVGANIDFVDGALSVTISPEPRIVAWLVSSTGEAPGFAPATLEGIILSQLWPLIADLVGDSLSLPLPDIDLTSVADLAPDLSDISTEIVLNRPVDLRGGYLILDGNLTSSTPLD